MPVDRLTEEQRAVVTHPFGRHARVLAVAGSGKTTTMVHRIAYLVREKRVNPERILVLMFNRLTRVQFVEKLKEIGIPEAQRPQVHNFHSYSYQLIGSMISSGLIPPQLFWIDDKAELVRVTVHRAIENLERTSRVPPDSVDPDDALEAIGLWKGSLIPPSRAGYRGTRYIPLVYAEFESLRTQASGLTFDDFVPLAVSALESVASLRQTWGGRTDFLIVDEYQDVNYGQQRLIELLAGQRADVMVVGDDDQTIYEWRGARPNYILREFETVFANKPHQDYKLSHSFRFGPVLAQCAENVIRFNANRIEKPLVAHLPARQAAVDIVTDTSEQPTDVSKDLAQQIASLVKECGDPRKVAVLVRMFSQLAGVEAELLARGIPYRVEGRAPFFERHELQVLLDYFRLSLILREPVSQQAHKLLLSTANTPNRKLNKKALTRAMERAEPARASTRSALETLTSSWDSPLTAPQRERLEALVDTLDRIRELVLGGPPHQAGDLLAWLVENLDYLQHFDNYYGEGESSEDRKRAVNLFCGYARTTGFGIREFIAHVERLDPTRGRPVEEQILMTTVFRTKGLEYDYVIIPSCTEGYMPYLLSTPTLVYDTAGQVKEPEPSQLIENERRLFYVAITRARKGVLIGASAPPAMGSQGKSGISAPSRFLAEIQREPTVAMMGPLQRLASGEPAAGGDLRAAVARHGRVKPVVYNLTAQYLPSLRDFALAQELQSAAAALPESQFAYPNSFSAPSSGTVPDSRGTSVPERHWWDDDEY